MNHKISTFALAILLPASAGAAEIRGLSGPAMNRQSGRETPASRAGSRFMDAASNPGPRGDADADAFADPLWREFGDNELPDMLAQRERGPMGGRGGRQFPPFGGPGRRPGPGPMLSPQLMEKLRDLPPDEQEKVLKNNERFQELPKRMQEQMIERLRRFQALPKEQRETIQKRFNAFNKFTPEERQKMRDFFTERWQKMPEDRHRALLGEFRRMRRMSPEEREKYLASPDVSSRFNADELDVLRKLQDFAPPPPPPGMMPPPRPEPHREGAEPQP